jgi:hypothetical protein
LCYCLDTTPSNLVVKYWQYSRSDICYLTDIKVGREVIGFAQDYENLIKVVSKALGGGSDDAKEKPKAKEPKNAEEAQTLFAAVFG